MLQTYALVGNWGFAPGPKGLDLFFYDPDGGLMTPAASAFAHVSVGHQWADEKRGLVYLVDERGSRRGETGGGGYALSVKIDPKTGVPSLLNERETLSPEPSYFSLDKSGAYALVAHHCDSGHVTKVRKGEKGYYSETLFDDAAVVLFRVEPDGSLGEAADVSIIPGEGVFGPHMIPHLHSVLQDPSGELYLVCDKGTDNIYSYGIDREKGRLLPLSKTAVPLGYAPRYGVFHPTLPLFYENNERKECLLTFSYCVKTGALTLLNETALLKEKAELPEGKKLEASSIVIDKAGKHLYVSLRGAERIVVLAIDSEGKLSAQSSVPTGENPRGIALSPDGRFLFAASLTTGSVFRYRVLSEGDLLIEGTAAHTACPGNLSFITL